MTFSVVPATLYMVHQNTAALYSASEKAFGKMHTKIDVLLQYTAVYQVQGSWCSVHQVPDGTPAKKRHTSGARMVQ